MRSFTVSPPLKTTPAVQYVFPRLLPVADGLSLNLDDIPRPTCRDMPAYSDVPQPVATKQVVAIRDLLVAVIVGAFLISLGAVGGFWAGSQHKPAPMPEMNLVLQPGPEKAKP